ncbi:BAG family molecular chaperone regulator 5, mitochondrial-like, partial [Dioscorea cayenensis subsp. rotundata]|uniref:BAG family molecular chaperone regulator 5, mitochondrial-like n=1 Tax=Dioscorea cayennensis subsp. rotundata TaxID=55577 RepID=A0AB40AXB0_DIOCR
LPWLHSGFRILVIYIYIYNQYYESSFYSTQNDQNAPHNPNNSIISIPNETLTPIPIPVVSPAAIAAASKIQSSYRSHLLRSLIHKILAVDADATRLEALIRRQDTVDAVRRDPRERAKLAEALMALLLRLDSIPGFYPPVRDLRRATTRRVVALQEVFDAVVSAPAAVGSDGFPPTWDELVAEISRDDDDDNDVEIMVPAKKGLECFERFLAEV